MQPKESPLPQLRTPKGRAGPVPETPGDIGDLAGSPLLWAGSAPPPTSRRFPPPLLSGVWGAASGRSPTREPPALTPGLSGSYLQPTHRGRWESHAPGRLALGVSAGGQGDPHPVLAWAVSHSPEESRGLAPETPTHTPDLLLHSWGGCLDAGCCWG